MKRIIRPLWLQFVLFLVMIPISSPQAQPGPEEPQGEEAILVGRITHVEGRVLRYVPDQEEWVAVVKDAPLGMNDALHSGEHGRAEFIMPNNSWARITGDTQIQLVTLKDDVTGIDIAYGVARFYNKGSNVVVKVTTPFGYVTALAGTCFDLYVGDDSVEVIASKGKVEFVHTPDEIKFEVIGGASSIVADSRQVTAGEGYGNPDWKRWNRDRDNLWQKRVQRNVESVRYLPSTLHHEAYVLDEYGRWAKVYYEGAYRYFWRPVHVSIGWAPFTVGRWTVWHREHCWIPAEPFGYMTHHYGNWILVNGIWYWAPPVARVRVRLGPPLFNIGFAWYPGRVAWIHFGIHIGWVPLAPREPYYSHHRWGRHAVVVKDINIRNIDVRINRLRYINRAVVIHKNNFHRVNSYKKIRIRNINDNIIISKYHAVPIVNNKVMGNYTKKKQMYNFRHVSVTRKPQKTVNKRIRKNQLLANTNIKVSTKAVRVTAKKAGNAKLAKGAKPRNTKAKSSTVHFNKFKRQVSGVQFKERKLNRKVSVLTNDKVQSVRKVQQDSKTDLPFLLKRQKIKPKSQKQALKEMIKRTPAYRHQVSEKEDRKGKAGSPIRIVLAGAAEKARSKPAHEIEQVISANKSNRPTSRIQFEERKQRHNILRKRIR